jgi:hypothetical protein
MSIADSRGNFETPLSIYQAIVEHQRNAEWWAHRDELEWLRGWGQTFIKEFAIKIKYEQFLPMPLVKIEPLDVRVTCAYRAEPDGYALAGAIVLNEKLLDMSDATKLALLLTMLLRAWRHQRCPDDLFVSQCHEGFMRVGLTVTKTGITIERGGRFEQLLRKHQIEIPANEIPWPKAEQAGDKLYSCRCQKVRVRRATFEATCSRCQAEFRPGNHVARKAARENGRPH